MVLALVVLVVPAVVLVVPAVVLVVPAVVQILPTLPTPTSLLSQAILAVQLPNTQSSNPSALIA